MNKVAIVVKSTYFTPKMAEDAKKKFAEMNVEGNYSGTCYADSVWTLIGAVADLKKVVYEHWQARGYYAAQEVLDEETMKTLGIEPDPAFDPNDFELESQLRSTAI